MGSVCRSNRKQLHCNKAASVLLQQTSLTNNQQLITTMQAINLADKLAQFDDYWSPRIVGELNGQHVKLAKLKGEFVWHHHDDEDELFYVVKGSLVIQFRDRDVTINTGEFLIVPRGVAHRPIAATEVHVMLFEPASTLNTGNVRDALTVDTLDHI